MRKGMKVITPSGQVAKVVDYDRYNKTVEVVFPKEKKLNGRAMRFNFEENDVRPI